MLFVQFKRERESVAVSRANKHRYESLASEYADPKTDALRGACQVIIEYLLDIIARRPRNLKIGSDQSVSRR